MRPTSVGFFRPSPRPLSLRAARLATHVSYTLLRHAPGDGSTPRHGSTAVGSPRKLPPHSPKPTVELVHPPTIRPPDEQRYDPLAWMSIMEPLLPDHVRRHSVRSSPPLDIISILVDAREWGSVDLVSHLWFTKWSSSDRITTKQYRWDAAEWLLNAFVDTAGEPQAGTSVANLIVRTPRAGLQTLDEATSEKARDRDGIQTLNTMMLQQTGTKCSLQHITEHKDRLQDSRSHRLLGEVWYRLGSILRKAMDTKDGLAQSEAVLLATRILTRVHDMPHLAQRIRLPEPAASSLIEDSRRLSNSVTPAVSLQHDAASAVQRSSPHEISALFEHVLWTCVSGGWIREASLLLVPRRDLRRGSKQRSQNLSIQPSQAVADEAIFDSHPLKESTVLANKRQPLGDAVISTVVDGILATISTLGTEAQTTAEDVMGDVLRLKRLKSHLEANHLSLGTASWDSVVARLLEHSNRTDGLNPRFMTSVLGMAGSYGMEGTARNTVGRDHNPSSPTYAFDVSAAMIGLYHQTLQAHIEARDVRGAMDTLTQLQSFTDMNKQRSMNEFLQTLTDTKAPTGQVRLIFNGQRQEQGLTGREKDDGFSGIEYPAYHPSIPPSLLAGLLNLTTDAELEEVGQWMIHSGEIDGPFIPHHLYTHPALAGALIRHAAHANDTDLLREVTRAQSNDLAGETLVALCYSFAVKANWKGTLRVISLSKQYSLHTWTVKDVGLIAKALLSHIQSPLRPKSITGAEFMLQKLLRGDLFLGMGPQGADLEALAQIISSIDGNMASLCENMIHHGDISRFSLPLECFNTLLEGISRSYGSLRAQDLYVQWCTPGHYDMSKVQRQKPSGEAGEKQSVAELFSRPAPDTSHETAVMPMLGEVAPAVFKPNLATIRIVIDQALAESRSSGDDYIAETVDEGLPTVKASFTELETMEWAAEILGRDFGMGEADIDYELQGYLSARRSQGDSRRGIEPLYREQTLTMWRALAGSRLAWAQEAEERMRSFARNTMERQMQFEPVAAAERYFLHCLAEEFGFSSATIGEGAERAVVLTKSLTTWQNLNYPVPVTKVGDAAQRYFAV